MSKSPPFAKTATRLDEMPGIGAVTAQVIMAEVGVDMTRFPTPDHLVSWARFEPGISESAGRKKGGSGTGHGNRISSAPWVNRSTRNCVRELQAMGTQ